METFRLYPYVSCVVDLPPPVAAAGFEFAYHCLAVGGRHPVVDGPSARLVLTGEVVRAQPESYAPWRSASGQLCLAGWHSPVIVQFELLPWSRSRSELGLTHIDRRWFRPSERQHRAYLRAAHDTLNLFRGTLEAPPPEWLSRLTQAAEPAVTSRGTGVSPAVGPRDI